MKSNKVINAEQEVVDNNNMFEITKGIVIPEKETTRKKGMFRSTLEKLEINDSFEVSNLPKSFYAIQKVVGIKLTNRKTENGFRIWRTK